MSKLRFVMLVGLLTAAITPLYGCGSECADGTTDEDGQCVVAGNGCAEGTVLQSGQCVLDTTGCGEGTTMQDGQCVPAAEVCTGASTYDEDAQTCVPDTEVLCGPGTELGDDGSCVAGAEACGDKTQPDDDGQCVIDAAICGEGTELDPNSGECVLLDAACGEGLALDADSGACVSTDEVCEPGTTFDAESGMCLNDSCSPGDVLIDGVCTAPVTNLIDEAAPETENNDPAYEGVPNTLTVNGIGADPYVFSGTIGEPTDLDEDGVVDQDVDVYEFEAESGEWFEIAIHSTGLQAPAFMIEGPEDFVRYSPIGHSRDATRQIVAQEGGTYTLTVLPSLVLQSEGEVAGFGGEDWGYVGTLEVLSPAGSTEVDMSSGEAVLDGDYLDLTDNLYEFTGAQAGDLIRVSINGTSSQISAFVEDWSDSSDEPTSQPISSQTSVQYIADGDSSFLIFFDWMSSLGPDTAFELEAFVAGTAFEGIIEAGLSESITVSAEADQYLVGSHTNDADAELEVVFKDPSGAVIGSSEISSGEETLGIAETAGDYTVEFINTNEDDVNATVIAQARPKPVLGPLTTDANQFSDSLDFPGALASGTTLTHELILDDGGDLQVTVDGSSGDPDLAVYDSAMSEIGSSSDSGSEESLTVEGLSAGSYFIEVEASSEVPSHVLTAKLIVPPDFSSSPALDIPDSDTVTGASDTITVSGCSSINSVSVYLEIIHSYRGDLDIDLTSPAGTTVRLWEDTGAGDDDLIGWMPQEWTPAESLDAFIGEGGDGEWTMDVYDDASIITGTFEKWGLTFDCQ